VASGKGGRRRLVSESGRGHPRPSIWHLQWELQSCCEPAPFRYLCSLPLYSRTARPVGAPLLTGENLSSIHKGTSSSLLVLAEHRRRIVRAREKCFLTEGA
jgi:hypothetical protein